MTRTRSPLPPVIYEDDALIAFAKAPGLLVVADRWDASQENLMALVHRHLSPQIFNAHRLDRGTSGVLLCAKTPPALRAVSLAFERGEVRKYYLALTTAAPSQSGGSVGRPLAPDPRRAGRMRTVSLQSEGAKPAHTDWTVLERWRTGHALLRAEPRTGRTHQVRVHLSSIGAPIVCDELYGNPGGLLLSQLKRGYKAGASSERPLLARLGLHAQALELAHPIHGGAIRIEAPLPADLELALKMLRRWAQAP